MDIIAMAFGLTDAVKRFAGRAKSLYYAVVLMGHDCDQCGGSLLMIGESRCRCESCGRTFDPTIAFQRCADCGGGTRLRIRRYVCKTCGADVTSRFIFDGLVFDTEYFRRKMTESRCRKQQRRQQAQAMAAENRSASLPVPEMDLESVPGLVDALDGLSACPEAAALMPMCKGFDLRRYERHLQAHIGSIEVCFDNIPSLTEDARLDRIWRFIAVIFMAHSGLIEICQEGQTILVSQHGPD